MNNVNNELTYYVNNIFIKKTSFIDFPLKIKYIINKYMYFI